MLDQAKELQIRSKKFAVSLVKFYKRLPKTDEGRILGKQLLRSSTSVAANYRSVCRSRSRAELIAKMGVVVEEADESLFWFEILTESEIVNSDAVTEMMQESEELLHIFSSSLSTARSNDRARKFKQ